MRRDAERDRSSSDPGEGAGGNDKAAQRGPVRVNARPTWYKRPVAEIWMEVILLPRDAVALHLLLGDLAFARGPLPEDEDELYRVAGVSADLWRAWPEIAYLWPVVEPNRGARRGRMNPLLADVFAEAAEAADAYRARSKKAARERWNRVKGSTSSNAPSIASGNARVGAEETREEEKEEETCARAAREAPRSIRSGVGARVAPSPNADGKIRLPSGWFASLDGRSIEKAFVVYERRRGSGLAAAGRYVGQDRDGTEVYVTGASLTAGYSEKIRAREREILRGHPEFATLFPETSEDKAVVA